MKIYLGNLSPEFIKHILKAWQTIAIDNKTGFIYAALQAVNIEELNINEILQCYYQFFKKRTFCTYYVLNDEGKRILTKSPISLKEANRYIEQHYGL